MYDRFKHSRSLRSTDNALPSKNHPSVANSEALTSVSLLPDDNTLVRILVLVEDINDNAPEFISKIFTGGVTTSTSFGTEFMQIKVS